MADLLRNRDNSWFQKKNHLALKKNELTKTYTLDAAVTRLSLTDLGGSAFDASLSHASTTSITISNVETSDASDIDVEWADGSTETIASGGTSTKTYGSATAGNVKLTATGAGADITRIDLTQEGDVWNFALSDLPSGLTIFRCQGSNTVSGDLSDLPSGLTIFRCEGSNTVSGDLSNLPSGLTYFLCQGSNTVSGDLSNLPSGLTYFLCEGSNTVSGDLSNLPSGLVYFQCEGSNTVTITGTLPQSSMQLITVLGTGLSSSIVDDILIAAAAISTWTGVKVVDLSGANSPRTTASDSAVSTLNGYGVTVACTALIAAGGLSDQTFTRDVAITPVDVSADFTGSGITYALAPSSDALPAGLSLSSAGSLSGTPTALANAASIVIRGTNSGGSDDSAFSLTVADVPDQMTTPALTVVSDTEISVDHAAAPAANNSAITSYDLRHSTDEATWTTVTGITDPQSITGLSASTLYYVQTRAVNAIGNGAWSASATATTDAGGAFDPATLFTGTEKGLIYNADTSTCFTDTGGATPAGASDAVARINDESGLGNHATQSTTTKRPILGQDGDGRWRLRFDGIDDALAFTTAVGTVWTLVIQVKPFETTNAPAFSAYTSSANRVVFYHNDAKTGAGGPRLFISGTDLIDISGSDTSGVAQTFSILVNGTGTKDVRVDGSSVGTSADSVSADLASGQLGGYQTSQFANLDIYKVFAINKILTGTDLTNVESWAAAI